MRVRDVLDVNRIEVVSIIPKLIASFVIAKCCQYSRDHPDVAFAEYGRGHKEQVLSQAPFTGLISLVVRTRASSSALVWRYRSLWLVPDQKGLDSSAKV